MSKRKFSRHLVWILLAVLISAFLGGLIVSAISNRADNAPNEKFKASLKEFIQEDNDISYDMEEEFMIGCIDEADGQYDYCQCTYDYLEDEVGKSGLIDMSMEFVVDDGFSDRTADLMSDAIVECLGEYKY